MGPLKVKVYRVQPRKFGREIILVIDPWEQEVSFGWFVERAGIKADLNDVILLFTKDRVSFDQWKRVKPGQRVRSSGVLMIMPSPDRIFCYQTPGR